MIATRRSWGNFKPPLGVQIDSGHPLARGLVGCWLFNEGAGAPHDIVTGFRGALTGNAKLGVSLRGPAMKYDGAGDSLNLITGLPAMHKVGSGSFTLSSLVIHTVVNATQSHYRKDDGTPRTIYMTRLNSNGTFQAFGSATPFPNAASTTVAQAGVPYLVQCTRDIATGEITISVNGRQEATYATGDTSDLETGGTPVVNIGSYANGGSEVMNGAIVFSLLHNYVMPAALRLQLHLEPYAFLAPPAPYRRYFHVAAPSGALLKRLHTEGLFVGGHAA